MKVYRVSGNFQMGSVWQKFSKEVLAKSEAEAREKIYSIFGSKHRVKRGKIKIVALEEISKNDVIDPVVKYLAEKETRGDDGGR